MNFKLAASSLGVAVVAAHLCQAAPITHTVNLHLHDAQTTATISAPTSNLELGLRLNGFFHVPRIDSTKYSIIDLDATLTAVQCAYAFHYGNDKTVAASLTIDTAINSPMTFHDEHGTLKRKELPGSVAVLKSFSLSNPTHGDPEWGEPLDFALFQSAAPTPISIRFTSMAYVTVVNGGGYGFVALEYPTLKITYALEPVVGNGDPTTLPPTDDGIAVESVVDEHGSGGQPPPGSGSFEDSRIAFGDFDHTSTVDGKDFLLWQQTFGSTGDRSADASGNGVIDADDYSLWKEFFGETPPDF